MFWCCGRKSKKAPGCIMQKHESKDAFFEEKEHSAVQEVKCYSCKEVGHEAKNCDREPNLKSYDIMTEGNLLEKEI